MNESRIMKSEPSRASDEAERLLQRMAQSGLPLPPQDEDDPLMAWEQRKAARYNASRGKLTGYDCPKCLNRGDTMLVYRDEAMGMVYERYVPCSCMTARRTLARMEKSGLGPLMARCRFDNFDAAQPWQRDLLDAARRYAQDDTGAWLFMGGAVGSGKTHLCTAVCRTLIEQLPLVYAVWPEEAPLLARGVDRELRERHMRRLMDAPLLYLDDFLKTTAGHEPTQAELNAAFELINHRYLANRRTIISSEHLSRELAALDKAIGGRIAEKARGYVLNIARLPERDHRREAAGELG